jgi:hypothetical protein
VSIRYPIKRKLFSEFTASVRKDENLWLIDHNASGIVTSGGAVTAWTNSGTGGSAYDMDVLLGTGGLTVTTINGLPAVQASGVGGIETTVAPANIPTPMTMFMVGKADLLNNGIFYSARSDFGSAPYILAGPTVFSFNAGSNLTSTPDTDLHLHTVRHNGDATTSYQIDSNPPVIGNAGTEPFNFGSFLIGPSGASNQLTGSMGRFVLKADTTNSLITERVQQQLKRKYGL